MPCNYSTQVTIDCLAVTLVLWQYRELTCTIVTTIGLVAALLFVISVVVVKKREFNQVLPRGSRQLA